MLFLPQLVLDVLKETTWAVQHEAHLGNQAAIDVARRQRGEHCNLARLTAHQLQQPDPVDRGARLHLRAGYCAQSFADRDFEAEALVDEHDVVADCLRDLGGGNRAAKKRDIEG